MREQATKQAALLCALSPLLAQYKEGESREKDSIDRLTAAHVNTHLCARVNNSRSSCSKLAGKLASADSVVDWNLTHYHAAR